MPPYHWLFLAQLPVNRYSEAKIALQRLYPAQNSWYQQKYPPSKESKRSLNYSHDPPHPFVKKNYALRSLDKARSWIYQTIAVHPTRNLSFSRRGHVSSCCKIKFDTCNRHCKLNRVFSLTWPASMQIYWNKKRKRLHKKGVQLPQDWFGTPTWPPFHCFGTPIWPPWRHVKTLYTLKLSGRESL